MAVRRVEEALEKRRNDSDRRRFTNGAAFGRMPSACRLAVFGQSILQIRSHSFLI